MNENVAESEIRDVFADHLLEDVVAVVRVVVIVAVVVLSILKEIPY